VEFAGNGRKRASGHSFEHGEVLRIAEIQANSTRGSRGRLGWRWRRTPQGGGAAYSDEAEQGCYGSRCKGNREGTVLTT
jgi:hypothetical protein